MSYVRTHGALGNLSAEQEDALLAATPEEIKALPVEQRLELAFRHREVELQKRSQFWEAVSTFATAALPIATFFGVGALIRKAMK
jgi:hypothetical protein